MRTGLQPDTTSRRLAVLGAAVRQLERHVRDLEGDRREDDDALLLAIADVTGGRVFDAGELLTATAHSPDLAAALDGRTNPKSVGQWLARLARTGPRRGLRLRALDKRTERGCIWIVEIHEPSGGA